MVSTTTTQIRVCFPEKFSLDEPFDLDSSTSLSSSDWSPSHRSNLGEGSSTGELRGWRLDIGRPDLVFERMRAAVHSLGVELDEVLEAESQSNHDSSNPSSSSSTLSANPNISLEYLEWKENILQGTVLRDVLLKGFEPGRAGTRKRHLDEAKRDGEGHEGESSSSSLSAAHEEELVNEETDPFGGIDFEPEEAPTTETPSVEGVVTKIDHGIFFEDQRIQSWVRRYSLPVPLVMDGDMPLPGLNPSQIRAMALMIGKRVSLVQGVRPSLIFPHLRRSTHFELDVSSLQAQGKRKRSSRLSNCSSRTSAFLILLWCAHTRMSPSTTSSKASPRPLSVSVPSA